MSEKYDLAGMLREIREETTAKADGVRAMSQDEIRRMIAEKKKKAAEASEQSGRNSVS
jgi:vacuolar-type H+-ATPase subunit E/Vma4